MRRGRGSVVGMEGSGEMESGGTEGLIGGDGEGEGERERDSLEVVFAIMPDKEGRWR
jgi:hypothetical protein